jgi:hypothetical protein
MVPEAYIVRIYRRCSGPPIVIAGRIEIPAGGLCASFTSLAELTAIIEAPDAHLCQPEVPQSPGIPESSDINWLPQKP